MSSPRASSKSACRCVSPMFSPVDQMPAAVPAIRHQHSALDLHAQTSVSLFRPAGAALGTKSFVISPDTKTGSDADLMLVQKCVHLTLPLRDASGSRRRNKPWRAASYG